ncbi:hypothetical protein QBC38DRAFT_482406 [Podospora fimiseda]|uniref:Ankyrin n=1 Tax=Podospora fimiseda TaxID=252190 RepID=A0AAN7GZD3_9PEZI|nr:hypothetical protein QBC38DRAFT_482406 [Podospora fimiseda]
MAEILGILAGVAGLADVGMKVSLRLRDIAQTWNNAPDEILALNNEVSDLIAILRFTEDACRMAKNIPADCTFTGAVEEHVKTAHRILEEIETVVILLKTTGGTNQKRIWVRLKQSTTEKKEELKAIRLKIWDLLQSYQVSAGAKIQLELGSVQLTLKDNAGTISRGFQSMDQGMKSLNHNLLSMVESVAENRAATQRMEQSVSEIFKAMKDSSACIPGPFSPNLSTSQVTPEHRDNNPGTHSIWAVYRERTCATACICVCHTARSPRSGFKTPIFLRGLVGSLFASYTGIPQWGRTVACDTAMCHRQYSRIWELEYQFPLWFTNWNVHTLVHMASKGSPMLSLVFRQRVEYRLDNIFRAVDSNNLDAIQAILARNPDSVNYRIYRDGCTPLHYACLRPAKISFGVFQLLLRAGADLNAENDSGRSPLSYLASHMVLGGLPNQHSQEICKLVSVSHIMQQLELSPVAEVAVGLRVGDVEGMLRALPQSKLKLNEFDNTGSTPLCWAAKAGNIEAIRAIVQVGHVNINQSTKTGNSPLLSSFALQKDVGEMIDWLLDNGADPMKQNCDGYNALTLACYLGRFDVVQKLIERGVDPDIQDGQGRTGLSSAIPYDHVHIARYLYKVGADVNTVNTRGFSPLLVAIGYNAHRCLRMLLFETEANYLFQSDRDWNSLHHAGACGDAQTMDILAEHGLAGLNVRADSCNLNVTAEDAFFSRPAGASESTLTAFRNLLAVVEKNTTKLKMGKNIEIHEKEESIEDEKYFDALS